MRIVTVAQAAELDQKAMQDHGISGIDLMGAAGKAIAEEVKDKICEADIAPTSIDVLSYLKLSPILSMSLIGKPNWMPVPYESEV